MGPIPEQELFSAYLDGELTSAEQARVEQLLATSSAARQLLEELRALSHTLQSLPGERLSEDISASVLREAERRMLAESPRPLRSAGQGAMGRPDWTAIFRRLFRPRVMICSAVAVAIALMFTLRDHNRPELAQAPSNEAARRQVAQEMPAKPAAPAALPTESASPAKTSSTPAAAQVANTPTDQQSAPTKDATSAPAEPSAHPAESPKPQAMLAESTATEAAPAPAVESAVESAPAAPPEAESPAKPSEAALVVHCDIRAEAVEQGLLDKLLAEQKIAKQADVEDAAAPEAAKPDEATDSDKTIRVRVAISDAQLAALLAQLKAHPEAFVSVVVEPSQPSEAGDSSSAVAETGVRRGVAASVKVQDSSGRAKSAPKSRVIFEPNAPPPLPPKSPSAEALLAEPSSAAESRPVILVLHVVDAADSAPSAESKSAQE
jgi:hypothetical protein